MSFETITIERTLPILNKRFVKRPNAELNLPPVDVSDITDGTGISHGTLNINVRSTRNIIPFYQMNSNLDFVTLPTVGLNGYTIGESGPVQDYHEEIANS